MTEDPAGKGSKMGLGTDLSKVSGMSKDASSASLRRYPVLPELRRLIREFARATFRTYLPALLAALPAPITCKLRSFIVRLREAIAIVSIKVLSSAHSAIFARERRKKSLSSITNFSNFKQISPFDIQQARMDKREASAKVYLSDDFVSPTNIT